MLNHVTSTFATATLIQGPESLLAERAVRALVDRAVAERPDATVTHVQAAELDRGALAEMTGGSLFSTAAVAVIEQLGDLPAELFDDLVALVQTPPAEVTLILVHEGGAKGRGLLDRVRKAGAEIVEAKAVKAWELPQFVSAEVRQRGGRNDDHVTTITLFLADRSGVDAGRTIDARRAGGQIALVRDKFSHQINLPLYLARNQHRHPAVSD